MLLIIKTLTCKQKFRNHPERGSNRRGGYSRNRRLHEPEQARGKQVDKRSDIFSFGSVLYEMLTGRRTFQGEDVSDILAAVLKTEPDWSLLPANIDARIRGLLRGCLKKDRKERRRDIGDVRAEIRDVLAHPDATRTDVVAASPQAGRWSALLLALAASLLAGFIGWSLKPGPRPQPLTRLEMLLPSDHRLATSRRHGMAISPDGRHVVYSANYGQLYLRAMDETEATPIRGTEDVWEASPFFSPDGEWIGFHAAQEGKLKKVSVRGGAAITLCEAGTLHGASWASDGTIVFGRGREGIWRVSADGGTPEFLVEVDSKQGEIAASPHILPGGDAVLFTLATSTHWDDAHIVVQRLGTGERRVLIDGGSDARYVPTGHVVYAVAGAVLAAPFDLTRLEVTGGPVPVLENVGRADTFFTGAAHFNFSDTGTLVYLPRLDENKLVLVDREGNVAPLTEKPGVYQRSRISPDGERLAIGIVENGRQDVWMYEMGRDVLSRFTTEGNNVNPTWSPDGRWVAFASDRGGDVDLYRKPADGSGPAERLLAKEYRQAPISWSTAGIAYIEYHPVTGRDVWVLPVEGNGEPVPVVQSPVLDSLPDFSPDGRFIAYLSQSPETKRRAAWRRED